MTVRQFLGHGVVLAMVLLGAGCMTVSDSRQVVQNSNSGHVFAGKKISLLPVKTQSSLAPDSVTGIRAGISRTLGQAMHGKLPSAAITDISTVSDQLNQKNALGVFEQMMQTYENTGVYDRQKVASIGQMLGADYLLMSRLKAEKMDLLISKGMGGSLDLNMIDVRSGQVVWGGSGEWKRGGIFGFGSATAEEAANGLVDQALAGLR